MNHRNLSFSPSLVQKPALAKKNRFLSPLAMAILVFSLGGCAVLDTILSKIPKPGYALEALRIKEVNLSEITLELMSSIENPYNVSLPTSQLGLDLFLEGKKLSHIDTDLGAIQAKSTKKLPMDIKLKYTDLLGFYKNFPDKEALNMKFKGDMKLPLPANYQQVLGMKEMTFPIEVERPLPSVNPDVEISNFQVKMPDLKSLAMNTATSVLGGILGGGSEKEAPALETSFDLVFKNKNPAKILLSDLKFDMELDGNSFLNMAPKEIIHEGTSNLVKVNSKIPILDAGSALVKTFQKKSANYEIKGLSGISFPGIDTVPANFNYAKKGNLKF